MAYIGYLQVGKLFENHNVIQGLTGSLQAELEAFIKQDSSEDERLYSMSIGNRDLYQDVPITSRPVPGQRMTAVVADYHSIIADQDRQAIREIITDIKTVQVTLEKLSTAMTCLTDDQMQVIDLCFLQGKTTGQISWRITKTDSSTRRIRKQALELIAKVCRISLEHYNRIMELIEGVELRVKEA